ncbi:MAG: hypothetical protein AAGF07_00860 [Patescibacteria group bacterium]
MAFKSFSKLSSRNQSSLISQLHKLIVYYGEIFSPRERVYLKNLSKVDGAIYWLEDDEKKLAAAAIVDQNYFFEVNGLTVKTLGHTVSKRPGQMDRILSHIFTDNEDSVMILLSRPAIAASLQHNLFKLIQFSPIDLITNWSELANTKTDYFNITKETLAEGMSRKNHHLYLYIPEEALRSLEKSNTKLADFIKSRLK